MTDNQLQEIVMIRKINGFGQKYNSIIGTFPEIAGLFAALGNKGMASDNLPALPDDYSGSGLDNLTLTQYTFTALADGYQPATLQGVITARCEDYVFGMVGGGGEQLMPHHNI